MVFRWLDRTDSDAIQQGGKVLLVERERLVAPPTTGHDWEILGIRLIQQNSGWDVISGVGMRTTIDAMRENALVAQRPNLFHCDQAGTNHSTDDRLESCTADYSHVDQRL